MGSNHEKKTGGRKSRDILPLKGQCHCTTVQHNPVHNVLYEPASAVVGENVVSQVSLLIGQCVQPNPVQNVLYEPAGAVVGEAVVSRGGGG